MRRFLPFSILLLACVFAGASAPLRAVMVDDLTAALLPVADRSASSLAEARRAGLGEVLVRLSGQRSALDHPLVDAALRRAERYLGRYSYREVGGELGLWMEYDEQALRALLREAGLPLWTANRPEVLAWVVVSEGGQRRFAAADETPQLNAALREEFQRRGVPLRLPLYDLADLATLPLGAAWRQESAALSAASLRYGDVEMLAGRVARLSDGRWFGDWRFLQGGRWQAQTVSVASAEEFAAVGADIAARSLAARYAVVASEDGDLRLRVTLTGVRGFASYRRVRDLLAALEPVDQVLPERIEPERVLLRLESSAQQDQLARIIELDSRFQRRAPPPGEPGLHYHWQE